MTDANVYALTEVSVKYALAGLKSKCVKHLKAMYMNKRNVEKRLYPAFKFQEDTETSFFRDDLDKCNLALTVSRSFSSRANTMS